MNQEEELPTRVTRGALRRRSVDQEATPQKPSVAVVSGTPKKTNSTTKRLNALNPIQESEGRPSTPIVGRNNRRRTSETIDTPTSFPNKLVQNLKEAGAGSEPGKRSRNTSLTEENLNAMNVAFEGSSAGLSTRSRTPARVRASHETLITCDSSLTVTPALRRSTRRNSITSDDGNISVQSLPVTTPKISSGARVLKDDTIIEEDAGDDRDESVSSETSVRQMRSQSVLSQMSAPASPRYNTASPVLAVKTESTPPRVITTPRVALTPLSLSKMSPRSKNVSFSEESKRDPPKTPTSVSKEVFIVVEDLRNYELKGVSPKVDAVVELSPKSVKKEVQESKGGIVENGNQTLNETSKIANEDESMIGEPNNESAVGKVSDNDVSGIDVLDPPVKQAVDTTEEKVKDTVNDSIRTADESLLEGHKFPHTWTPPVRRSATIGIDEYSVRKQEEQERAEEAKESMQMAQEDSSFKASSPARMEKSPERSEEKEGDEEETQRNEFIDDEALEVEDYQSCDSLESDLRKEIDENDIHGEELGSQDSEDSQYQEDDDYGNDSFIVDDDDDLENGQQQLDEEQLLRSSNDDLTEESPASRSKQSKAPLRKRIIEISDDSEDEEDKETGSTGFEKKPSPPNSPKDASLTRRSETPVSVQQTNDSQTIKKTVESTPSKPGQTPVKVSSSKKQLSEPDESTSEKKEEAHDCSTVMFEDVMEVSEKGIQNDKEVDIDVSLTTSPKKSDASRKSLPAAKVTERTVSANVRKSLPAGTKLQTSGKINGNEVGEITTIENDGSENKEVMDAEEKTGVETPSQGNETMNESSSSSQVALEQPAHEAPASDRKSVPPVSLISAQFYIGGKKNRNTVVGDDSNMFTSTPKPNESSTVMGKKNKQVVGKMNSKDSNSVVPNPFALAISAKLKSRVSLDSGTAMKQEAFKKSRLSLPNKFVEEDVPSDGGVGVSDSQEPEPMEVDIEEMDAPIEDAANAQNDDDGDGQTDDDDDDVSVQDVKVVEKRNPKAVKPKPKALEDYNLANILVRCNEVMREEKERKKQLASVLRKKMEEKKRQRELQKQEEQEAAMNAANASTDNDADPNNANGLSRQGEEPSKKKKKKKPKVKNYLLEELAETKKERMEQALRHKLEVLERRKQRKKNRQLEKKQLDKENGEIASVTGGIGAKLEKMKKKQKAKANDEAKTANEGMSKDPSVRVALSAFAVFNQLQLTPSVAAVGGKQVEPSVNGEKVMSPSKEATEKKQLLKSPTENGTSNQQPNAKEILKTKKSKDSRVKVTPVKQPQTEPVGKKKLAIEPVSGVSENTQQHLVSPTNKTSVDLVAKPAKGKVTADPEPYNKDEKQKEKKKKKKQISATTLKEADIDVPKQKKNKPTKLNEAAQDHGKPVQAKPSSAIGEFCAEAEKVGKIKTTTKKLTAKMDDGNTIELPRKKSITVVTEPLSSVPAKKRKREQHADSSVVSTPRPAKHSKLQVLQRIESGGFFVENVTPDKERLKRNFGFQERQATPAKQLGFKVSSLLPTGQDELRGMATSSKKYLKNEQKKSKYGEQNLKLPLPVWTSSGVFFESAAEENVGHNDKKVHKEKSGYIKLKGQGKGEFNLKILRPGAIAEKPHRVDSITTDQSVLTFKRQQLLEKTAHLREKKSQRV
uniref:Uncharacterized protein n=1 Tax=Anopheles minimus TaxID=112268 RepID=A0A182W335_9DIPT